MASDLLLKLGLGFSPALAAGGRLGGEEGRLSAAGSEDSLATACPVGGLATTCGH